jgi:hypothetical protein
MSWITWRPDKKETMHGQIMVSYWHWATTANAIETYWRGVLSQDYQPNAVYAEVETIGYVLNYSAKPQRPGYGAASGTELLSGRKVVRGRHFELKPWGVAVVEEE